MMKREMGMEAVDDGDDDEGRGGMDYREKGREERGRGRRRVGGVRRRAH